MSRQAGLEPNGCSEPSACCCRAACRKGHRPVRLKRRRISNFRRSRHPCRTSDRGRRRSSEAVARTTTSPLCPPLGLRDLSVVPSPPGQRCERRHAAYVDRAENAAGAGRPRTRQMGSRNQSATDRSKGQPLAAAFLASASPASAGAAGTAASRGSQVSPER